MEELMKAIERGNTKEVARLLYLKADELSDEELREVLEKAEELAKKSEDYELYKLVLYYYAEVFGIDKLEDFEKLAEKDGFEVKFHLADLHFLLGNPEKALEIYRGLIEEEASRGNRENLAKVYYNMALIHEELHEYEKALELLKKAEEILEELGAEEDLLHVKIYEGYVTFELGKVDEAKAMLAALLPRVKTPALRAQLHLAFEEIFEEEDNYEAALQECLYALVESKETEQFEVAFDALIDVVWQLILEDDFELVYRNMPMFAAALPEIKDFFEGIKAIALYKAGKVGREEVTGVLMRVKDRRLLDILEFLGEAEL
ncbi:tetratricopeptide repeat protein [Pyrococcus yayanosii]|uniref:Tetratricopeptide repeat domain protein n=1 Tax=Pyrococcus yayanosii (strain CH1 / JCM 16557) TaxID=529709 RepID=F8AH71_PYRYC|nr:tetratricopeptide repeat protein [Pyrococcus yayanosii]AEH25301.1 tetratricopeptide repeat domain protein [Pyrococcus yayanosii CH1]